MRIIAFIAYFFWGILGLLFWIPLLVRIIASFCGSLSYNMIVNDPNNIQNSKHSLELAIGFYSKGFESIHSTIFGTNQRKIPNTPQEFYLMSFLFQIIWTIFFWGTIILPFTRLDLLSFRKEYIFKEPFDNNSHNWILRETGDEMQSINNGQLFMQSKDSSPYLMAVNFCDYSIDNYPPKYTFEANIEFINGDFRTPFGIMLTDKDDKNEIRFNIFNDKYASVLKANSISKKILCDSILIDSESRVYKIKISVNRGEYIYYVNDTQIYKDNFTEFTPTKFRTYVSRTQNVGFDDINIYKN